MTKLYTSDQFNDEGAKISKISFEGVKISWFPDSYQLGTMATQTSKSNDGPTFLPVQKNTTIKQEIFMVKKFS